MRHILTILIFAIGLCSCKKYLEVGIQATDIDGSKVFNNEQTATSSLLSIYAQMENNQLFWDLIRTGGTSSDELQNNFFSTDYIEIATNSILPTNSSIATVWSSFYHYIYNANAVIEGVAASTGLSESVRRRLRGEALFIRAFCYYYLVNNWGDVPFVVSTNYEENSILERKSVTSIIEALVIDLIEAQSLLDFNYLDGANKVTSLRVRPNRSAVSILLARIHLQQGNYVASAAAAQDVISNSVLQLESDLTKSFLIGSREAIWQLQSVWDGYSSSAGYSLIYTFSVPNVTLHPSLISKFDLLDKRLLNWIGFANINGHPYWLSRKYIASYSTGPKTEYTMAFRLSEAYLIRSEAFARSGQPGNAEAQLNIIRNRAGISPVSGLALPALLDSIAIERQRELFCESGDRWYDLKRRGAADAVLAPIKGASWQSTDTLYPIPLKEILRNPKLTQNPGY